MLFRMLIIIQMLIVAQFASSHEIHDAAFKDDIEKIDHYLYLGIDVDILNSQSATPLHCASEKGNLESVKLLIGKNADPNFVHSPTSMRPLHYAAAYGKNTKVLEYLVDAGARINETDTRGHTALHLAASAQDFEAYEFLKSKGADENIINIYGKIPRDYLLD